MNKKVLITGISGFIGKSVARAFLKKNYDITGIIRPKTHPRKIADISSGVTIVEIDLTDIKRLKEYLQQNVFDIILHIGALRGGRKFPKRDYYDANVKATEQIAIRAGETNALMLFCSSVGVYGAIPTELPANTHTEFQEDNYYHYTKIKAEGVVQKEVLRGLRAYVIRPAITYGKGDYGFPYTLTKLVHRKLFFMPDMTITIHLANLKLVEEVFYKLSKDDYKGPKIYNVADRTPVKLHELVDFISHSLQEKPYPANRSIPVYYFRKAEKLAGRFGCHTFLNRIKLISYSWFYDVEDTFQDLYLSNINTITGFKDVIDWYREKKD